MGGEDDPCLSSLLLKMFLRGILRDDEQVLHALSIYSRQQAVILGIGMWYSMVCEGECYT